MPEIQGREGVIMQRRLSALQEQEAGKKAAFGATALASGGIIGSNSFNRTNNKIREIK